MQVSSSTATSALEFFPGLSRIEFVRHGFIGRIPGIDVATDRASALVRLDASHASLLRGELRSLGGDPQRDRLPVRFANKIGL